MKTKFDTEHFSILPRNNLSAMGDWFENIMQELDHLIGLDSIKKKIKEYTTYLNFLKTSE